MRAGTALGATLLLVAVLTGAHAAREDGSSFIIVEYNAQVAMTDVWKASIRSANNKMVKNSEVTLKPGDKVRFCGVSRPPSRMCTHTHTHTHTCTYHRAQFNICIFSGRYNFFPGVGWGGR